MQRKSYSDTSLECMQEMFKRVGIEYPNEELTKQEDWYLQYAWTPDQENEFRRWMSTILKKRYRWDEKKIELEVEMFLLAYGWQVDPKPWEVKKFKKEYFNGEKKDRIDKGLKRFVTNL